MDTLTPGPDRPEELRALLVLGELPGVGPAKLRDLVRRFGSAERALAAPFAAFARIAGAESAGQRSRGSIRDGVERALERASRAGMTMITWGATAYPASLLHLADPPPVLFLRGRLELLGRDAVTVVGSRRATSRGRDLAERLGARLAGAGACVVSGLALGVDGAAHRGALGAAGDTVAVLGTGADVVYPRAHGGLFHEILDAGLLVSEFLPRTPALPHHFPRRNRILAALGQATIVVEAGGRSGSLITVDHALDLGREVWVVPGPIERAACTGSNRLLAEGARPLLSLEHLVTELGLEARTETSDVSRSDSDPPPGSPRARVLRELAEPLTGDELAARIDIPVHEALALLTALEIEGAVRSLPDLRYARAA